MKTFYLIDFENVHNEGIENIDSLAKTEHVHIFSTNNALNIRMDIVSSTRIDKIHIVPVRKQSLDMHLVSYLGYLLGIHGNQCVYVIVSKDADYDNIIKFWKSEGYNISRKQKIPGISANKKKTEKSVTVRKTQTINNNIVMGMSCGFSGRERSKLNTFVQHELADMGYVSNDTNTICKYVIAHCNDKSMLIGIHNELRSEYDDYLEIYDDVKTILKKYESSKYSKSKRESQVRSFFGEHFKKRIYVDNKEEIISIILNSETKQQINNNLMKLFADGNVVKNIYQTIQPLTKDLPGK